MYKYVYSLTCPPLSPLSLLKHQAVSSVSRPVQGLTSDLAVTRPQTPETLQELPISLSLIASTLETFPLRLLPRQTLRQPQDVCQDLLSGEHFDMSGVTVTKIQEPGVNERHLVSIHPLK